jgi:hypothetical protein
MTGYIKRMHKYMDKQRSQQIEGKVMLVVTYGTKNLSIINSPQAQGK